jgi:virulence-associated protein VapD
MSHSPTKRRNIANPSLPVAPVSYEQSFMDQYSNVMRLYFNQVSNANNAPKPYGSFYSNQDQTNPVANTVNLMKFNKTVDYFNVSIGEINSRIYVSEQAIYNIQFSAQLDKSGGSASAVYIWLRLNGQNVANTATKVTIDGPNSEIVAAWNFVLPLAENDYVELAWQSSDTNVFLAEEPASGNVPEIPSVIVTVTWVSNVSV